MKSRAWDILVGVVMMCLGMVVVVIVSAVAATFFSLILTSICFPPNESDWLDEGSPASRFHLRTGIISFVASCALFIAAAFIDFHVLRRWREVKSSRAFYLSAGSRSVQPTGRGLAIVIHLIPRGLRRALRGNETPTDSSPGSSESP